MQSNVSLNLPLLKNLHIHIETNTATLPKVFFFFCKFAVKTPIFLLFNQLSKLQIL